jgi:hypothetical protein
MPKHADTGNGYATVVNVIVDGEPTLPIAGEIHAAIPNPNVSLLCVHPSPLNAANCVHHASNMFCVIVYVFVCSPNWFTKSVLPGESPDVYHATILSRTCVNAVYPHTPTPTCNASAQNVVAANVTTATHAGSDAHAAAMPNARPCGNTPGVT